jgi:hypothetical protein
MSRQVASAGLNLQAQNLPGRALGNDLHRPAANFAINREALKRYACVHCGFERLTAKRAMNGFDCFHVICPPGGAGRLGNKVRTVFDNVRR